MKAPTTPAGTIMASEQGVVSAGPVPERSAARDDLARLRPLAVALAAALTGRPTGGHSTGTRWSPTTRPPSPPGSSPGPWHRRWPRPGSWRTTEEGAFDTPFRPRACGMPLDTLRTPGQVKLVVPRLESAQNGAAYLLATQSAALASVFINDSGLEALPIGGFTGTIPSPTLRQLQGDIRQGRFHLVLAAASTDPRLRWIAAHCLNFGSATAVLHNYYCQARDAG